MTNGPDYATIPRSRWPSEPPGFCMLEWDIALAAPDRAVFAAHALEDPERVLVADYPIYPIGAAPAGTCRHLNGQPTGPDVQSAELFSTGCIYFPQPVLAEWWAGNGDGSFTDRTFAEWHHGRYGPVQVCPHVHPQHLHGD